MKITYHTNLDDAQPFVHQLNRELDEREIVNQRSDRPREQFVPRVGDIITFDFNKWENDRSSVCCFGLEVVSVRVNHHTNRDIKYWDRETNITVELHIPKHHCASSIAEWDKYFRKHVLGKAY